MPRILSFLIFLTAICSVNLAHADAFICIDQQGKKVFSSEACSKRGFKAASSEFPIVAGQAVSARVIMPKQETGPKLASQVVTRYPYRFVLAWSRICHRHLTCRHFQPV